jgi:Amt family ammonium transporter
LLLKLGPVFFVFLALAGPVLAASPSGLSDPVNASGEPALLAVGLSFLLPVGLILLSVAALSEEQAVSAITGALVAWGLAALAYFAAGFAFQFGGIAVFSEQPDLAGLYMEYSLLDTTWGPGWGMIGLKGFLMLGDAGTPGALTLFLTQLPLLGVSSLILYFALQGRARRWVILLASPLMGGAIYPIVGNWNWASGWLANLGDNLSQGHGLVDAGGGGQMLLVGASAAVAALLVFRTRPAEGLPAETETPDADPASSATPVSPSEDVAHGELEEVRMPPAQLPLLSVLGAVLMMVGWIGMAFLGHLPTAGVISPAPMAVNLALSALGGTLTSGLYSYFVANHLNPLMSARGLVAGLAVAAAGAPFVPAWSALAAGLVVGLILPPLIFLFDRVLRLDDTASALGTFGLPAVLGLLLPGLVADGRYGLGWNGIGFESYLGVEGQGVSGLLVVPGFAVDWPGQIYAQLIGILAIFTWSFGLSWLLMRILAGLMRAWERSGLEFGAPPEPVAAEELDDVTLVRDEGLEPGDEDEPILADQSVV